MKRPKGIRSDYELAMMPWEYMSPEEREWSDSQSDGYWVDVLERGERDLTRLWRQVKERDETIEDQRRTITRKNAEITVLIRKYVQATGEAPAIEMEVREWMRASQS